MFLIYLLDYSWITVLNFQNLAILGGYREPIVGSQDPSVVRMP